MRTRTSRSSVCSGEERSVIPRRRSASSASRTAASSRAATGARGTGCSPSARTTPICVHVFRPGSIVFRLRGYSSPSSGRGEVWLSHPVWGRKIPGSNPGAPILTPPVRVRAIVPLALAGAGIATMLIGTAGRAWPLALGWTIVTLIFTALWRWPVGILRRLVVGLFGTASLLVLVWEGGLFLVPALLAAVVLAPRKRSRGSVRPSTS